MSDTGKSVFGNTSGNTTTTSGSIFSAPFTTNTPTGGTSTTNPAPLFGLGGTSTGLGTTTTSNLFSTPKSTDSTSTTTPAQKVPNFFNIPAASTTSTNFGSTSGGYFGKPTDNAAKSTTTPTITGTSLGAGAISNGGLFGKKPETAATTNTTTTTTTAAAPLSGAFSLGGSKDATTTSTTATPSGQGLFSNLNANKEKKDAPAATATPPPTFNLFGPPKDITEKKDAPPAAPSFSLGVPSAPKDLDKQPAATTSTTVAAPATTVNTIAVPPPSALRGKTIEEIINKWSAELETHVRQFNKFAGEVAVWDRALIENGNNLAALYSHVLAAEREQNEIDQSLDHIEHQQKHLAATLEAYEKSTQDILGGQGGSLRALDTGPADTERDKNFILATDLHTHLDDLSASLTQIIESVNTVSQPGSDSSEGASNAGEDPIAQISQILSSHLESLQWVDSAVREVEGKVTEIEKQIKESGGGLGAPGNQRGFGLNR